MPENPDPDSSAMSGRLLRHVGCFFGYSLLGIAVAVVVGYSLRLKGMPDPMVWHTVALPSEFHARDADRVRTLDDYRALEDRLFAELQASVYDRIALENRRRFERYSRGGIADPLAQPVNWNRTFELAAPAPRGGVLLLHGLSDSPYSMRALAQRLNARGFQVIGLRLPGHGTVPSGLLDVSWKDWAAAVRIAARELERRVGKDKPLHIVGYSTGAALAVDYAISRAFGEDLPPVARMVLLSPAIGVSPAAALAVWQQRIGRMIGVPKLAWTDILPEYDPYKYNSFTANAAEQVYALTQEIAKRLDLPAGSSAPADFPRILAFQSVADATVSTPALIDALFRSLAPGRHELVLFDINREADVADLFAPGAPDFRQRLLTGPVLPFELTIIANANRGTDKMVEIHRSATNGAVTREPTDLAWPPGTFSLTHVALPFPPDDPIYGEHRPKGSKSIYLGRTALQGERGLLVVSPADLMRLRHNPFFEYMATRIDDFLVGDQDAPHDR
jgi:alpha-beta hydrolase superfamily lysophospholipase